jgi:signal transduction histidine kinase
MVWKNIQAGLSEGRPYQVTYRIRTASGELKWVWEQGRTILSIDGAIVMVEGFISNITERKRAEDDARRAHKLIELLNSITRHDINNQLLVLKGNIQMMKEVAQAPAVHARLERMERSADTIESQIRFTKEYQEMGTVSPGWQSIAEVLLNVLEIKEVEKVEMSEQVKELEIYADPMLGKVFHNLFEDTIKYCGGPATVHIGIQRIEDDLLLIYEDDGLGIPLAEKEKIFDKGFGKGTGLGLFLSREILAITDISIREVGRPGKGARFELTIPCGNFRFRTYVGAQ